MNTTLPEEILQTIKPRILATADKFVNRAERMVEGKFTAKELECLWAGALEWSLFVREMIPLGSEERHTGTQDSILGKVLWMQSEIQHQIELARANPIRVVVGIDGGKFRGASASRVGVKVEAFDWDCERKKATEFFAGAVHAASSDEIDDAAQGQFANATKGLVVLC